MAPKKSSCSVCRFMRSLAFSALGAGFAGYGGLALGLSRESAMIAAFFGALGLVVLSNKKTNGGR